MRRVLQLWWLAALFLIPLTGAAIAAPQVPSSDEFGPPAPQTRPVLGRHLSAPELDDRPITSLLARLADTDDVVVFLPAVARAYDPLRPTAVGEVIAVIPAPTEGAQGLVWDSAYLWVAWDDIYKLDPNLGEVLVQLPAPAGDLQDLAWDGAALWTVSYDTGLIYQLNPLDGAVLESFPAPGSKPTGLVWAEGGLWHSDESGLIYKIDPISGTVISEAPSPIGGGTTLLDWDGRYLWGSKGGVFYQMDTAHGQVLRTVPAPAQGARGIAWDGENLWSGGDDDDTLYLVDATPSGAVINGRVLKDGAASSGKQIDIVKNSNLPGEVLIERITTSGDGGYSFSVDPGIEYELRGFGDTANNELMEWVRRVTPGSTTTVQLLRTGATTIEVTLPDVEIRYDGLLAPADGASLNRDFLHAGNPLTFSWSARSGATSYMVTLRQHGYWGYSYWDSPRWGNTTIAFDGTLNAGAHLPAMAYDWLVGMGLGNGWWGWGGPRMLIATSTAISVTVDGDPGEWGAINPIAVDPAGDNTGGPPGTDVAEVRSYVDATSVYLMLTVHDPNIVPTATIELNLDYRVGDHGEREPTADLHTNIGSGGISAFVPPGLTPFPISGAEVAFGQCMEIRIPRDQLGGTDYVVPTFVNIWVGGVYYDTFWIIR